MYQDPVNPAIVELTQLNNKAQSNYTRFIPASASPEGSVKKSQSLAVTLNAQGYFSSKEFFRRWHGLLPDGMVQADYLGAYQLAPSRAELKI